MVQRDCHQLKHVPVFYSSKESTSNVFCLLLARVNEPIHVLLGYRDGGAGGSKHPVADANLVHLGQVFEKLG